MDRRIVSVLFLLAAPLFGQGTIRDRPDASSVTATDGFFCDQGAAPTVTRECLASQIYTYITEQFDTETEFETLLTDVTNMITEAEINTEAEIVAMVSDLATILQNTDIDTEAKIVAIVSDLADILQTTDVDTEAKLESMLTDVTDVYTDNDSSIDIAVPLNMDDGAGDSPALTLINQANVDWTLVVADSDDNLNLTTSSSSDEAVELINNGVGDADLIVSGDITGGNVSSGADPGHSHSAAGSTVTIDAADITDPGSIDHNNLTNYEADRHLETISATDCTSQSADLNAQCHDTDDNVMYVCESNPCAAAGWVSYGGGGAGDVEAVYDCASGDCNTITIGESEYLDGGAVDGTTDPYVALPRGTDCSTVTGEGRACWESDADILWIGDGAAAGGSAFGTFGNAIADGIGDTLTVSSGIGTSTTTTDDPETATFKLDWGTRLIDETTLGARRCVFSSEGIGGFLCAGATADDGDELLVEMPLADVIGSADTTIRLVAEDTVQTLSAKVLTTPDVTGKVARGSTSVSDDDCTGEEGYWWYDDTDNRFEFCNGVATTPAVLGIGSGAFTDGEPIVQNTSTYDVHFGDAVAGVTAKFELGGDTADQVVFAIQGHATQATDIVQVYKDDGTVLLALNNTGDLTIDGTFASGASATPSVVLKDSDGLADPLDDNARLRGNLSDTGDGSEDMDIWISGQRAGAEVDHLAIDADAGITLGHAATTAITLTTDSTGNGEVVLPNGAIGSAEIENDTILAVDFKTTGSVTDEYCWTYEADNGGGEWQVCGAGSGDEILIDTTAITDGSGVDLTSGVGVDITLATGPSPDTATFAVDNTELNDFTWGDGTDATMVHTFDPSGATSNPTIQAKDAELEFTIDGTNGVELVDVTGTPTLKILGTGSVRASSVVCDDCVNVSDLGDGADTALVGEYVRVNSGDATILEYRTNAETLSDIGAASTSHATTHSDAGSDEVTAENLAKWRWFGRIGVRGSRWRIHQL
jgi:hypothetical protein